MPFGKHRGKLLSHIDPSYLNWVLNNCENASLDLRNAIRKQLGLAVQDPETQRLRERLHAAIKDALSAYDRGYEDGKRDATAPSLKDTLKDWYRSLVKDYHPDLRHGNTDAMIAINDAYERLMKRL
jgi:hypothetical protein